MTGAVLQTVRGLQSPIIHIISPRVTYPYHRTVTATDQRSLEQATAQDGPGCTISSAPRLCYSAHLSTFPSQAPPYPVRHPSTRPRNTTPSTTANPQTT